MEWGGGGVIKDISYHLPFFLGTTYQQHFRLSIGESTNRPNRGTSFTLLVDLFVNYLSTPSLCLFFSSVDIKKNLTWLEGKHEYSICLKKSSYEVIVWTLILRSNCPPNFTTTEKLVEIMWSINFLRPLSIFTICVCRCAVKNNQGRRAEMDILPDTMWPTSTYQWRITSNEHISNASNRYTQFLDVPPSLYRFNPYNSSSYPCACASTRDLI